MDRVLTNKLKAFILESGMDLVGFAPVERWTEAPFLLTPQAILPESKFVIVAGIHITDTWTEMGGEPTPHDVGPGGFIDHNSLLDRISYRTSKLLEDYGYKAVPIAASNIWRYRQFPGVPRVFSPDLSHIHASTAAGLGGIGKNGALMTREHGTQRRQITIVTNAVLDYDSVDLFNEPCKDCNDCVSVCPMKAITETTFKIPVGDQVVDYPVICRSNCDWSKRYSLCPEEGPALIGCLTDVKPSTDGKISYDELCEACGKKDAVMKTRTVILEPCLRHCKYTGEENK